MVINIITSRGPRNHKNCVGSYETISLVNKSEIILLWIVASTVGNGASGASLTSKFILGESVVNVIIIRICIRHSLFPPSRTAKPIACDESRVRTKSAQSFSTFQHTTS